MCRSLDVEEQRQTPVRQSHEVLSISARRIPCNTHQQSSLDQAASRGLTHTRSSPTLSKHRDSKINQCAGDDDFVPKLAPSHPFPNTNLSCRSAIVWACIHIPSFGRIYKLDLVTATSKFLRKYADNTAHMKSQTPWPEFASDRRLSAT
jgi:hypothetical protein